MRVIVTGGSGRVGKAVIRTLVARGHEVTNIDRRPAERPGAKFVYMDLGQRQALQPVMESAEAVIHMGEIPHAKAGHHTEEEVFGRNCTVGSLVVQLASELKYNRFIYTSTIQIYGFTDVGAIAPMRLPIDEEHPARPQNCYAAGKVAVESYARMHALKQRLDVAVFRLPWVMTQEIEPSWFDWTEREGKIKDDMGIYVRDSDVAEAFALALEKPRGGFEIYNLSAKEVMFGRPIREAIARDFPAHPQLPEGWGEFDSPYLWRKANEHFGWQPAWNYLDEYRRARGGDPAAKE